MKCKICQNSDNNTDYIIKEMMFGLKDEFHYFECSKCGCLQIGHIPHDLSQYYKDYYSFTKRHNNTNPIVSFLRKKRNYYGIFGKSIVGRILKLKYKHNYCDMIGKTGIKLSSRILDVGCGDGHLLYTLKEIGFDNLIGLDPHIKKNVETNEVKIHKLILEDFSDKKKFDLIIFNHSFEHLPNQNKVLEKVTNLLSKNGICMISMPVKTEFVWDLYGTNWVQIDAPRHFFIHTLKSFELLLKQQELDLENFIFDSTEFLFWGSEQQINDIPTFSRFSYANNPQESIFDENKINMFQKKCKMLNETNRADQATFFLKKHRV